MMSLEKVLIAPDATILDAIRQLDANGLQIVLVAAADRLLLGTITDGDIRRGFLRGVTLDAPVTAVMNGAPWTITREEIGEAAITLMRRMAIRQVPVVDAEDRVVGLEILDHLIKSHDDETWVVLMLGGLGTRLRPLTETVPKPMIPVGGRPLAETIVRNFVAQGFRRFYFSVNYKAEVFREYFGDGSRFDARIEYLEETQRLGTAGALSLLPARPKEALIVMNGDLLTTVNFAQLVGFHKDHDSLATMAVREYSYQIPYGVVQSDGSSLTAIVEKPKQSCFVNAGIYTLSPAALDLIPDNQFFDMPQLFDRIMEQGGQASVFPIREYWLDIGRLEDLERAQTEFHQVFSE